MEVTGWLEDDERETLATLARVLQPAAVITGSPANDRIQGTPEADEIDARGGNDYVIGAGGDDQIRGRDGYDGLRGGPGHDTIGGGRDAEAAEQAVIAGALRGGDGADELRGDAGSDVLNGEGGVFDILIGGAGPDVFTFTTRGSPDRVLDFVQGEDQFDVSTLIPDFQPDDDLDLFVQLEIVPQGTQLRIDRSGRGESFALVADIEGVELTELTLQELGLPTEIIPDGMPDGMTFLPSLSRDGRSSASPASPPTSSTATTTALSTSSART